MKTFADKAINYFTNISKPKPLPDGVDLMNPYSKEDVKLVINKFFNKYFNDAEKRTFIIGINPGRFGGGLTGISFTDPIALKEVCGIENKLGNQKELSSKFVYKFINAYGGPAKFYSNCFLTALFPLAIIKDGKNFNYYDTEILYKTLKPSIVESLRKQVKIGAKREFAICLGKKNAKYLNEINNEYDFFNNVRVLDHPRYIMQYRLKQIDDYIDRYISAIKK